MKSIDEPELEEASQLAMAAPNEPPAPNRLPVTLFVVMSILTGVLYAVVNPPLQSPDEWNHLYRAWAISEGQFEPTREGGLVGFVLPVELPRLAHDLAAAVVTGSERHVDPARIRAAFDDQPVGSARLFVSTPNTAFLTSLIYLPQAAGISLGRLLDRPLLECLYLARFMNLLVGTLLVALALRTEPRRPWLMTLIALAPMAGYLRASASPDVVTIGIALWLTAHIASLALVEGAVMSRRAWLGVLAGSALLGPMKIVYAPIAFAAWLIPDRAFGSRAAAWRAKLLQGMIVVVTTAYASARASRLWAPFRPEVTLDPPNQLKIVLADPMNFAVMACADYATNGPRFLAQVVGQLGWLAVNLPKWLLVSYLLVIALVWWRETQLVLPRRQWLFVAFLVTSVIGGVSLSQYLIWTGVGADLIDGVQGRYVLPLIPLAAWLFPRTVRRWPDGVFAILTITAVTVATAISLHEIVMRYYPEGWASLHW